ncbi:MAG: rhodanese-like domain-containing protein [Flavitalea sp.]
MNHITPIELKEKLNSNQLLQLIDVREPYEHEAYNIGGTLIPFSEILEKQDLINTEIPVIFYCKVGIRSQIAIQRLKEKFGFTNLINLQGGMERWKKDIDQKL